MLEAAVVGLPGTDELVKPVATVVGRPGREPDPDELIAWCRGRLAGFKRPREVLVVDALPKTATGKVARSEIEEICRTGLREDVQAVSGSELAGQLSNLAPSLRQLLAAT